MTKHYKNNSRKLQIESRSSSISITSPIPPPAILQQYNELVPDAAERILSLVEKQSAHRQYLERKVIESDIFNSKLGLFFGFVIGMTSVIAGTYCILEGHNWSGAVIGGTGLSGLVSVFVYGTHVKRKDLENKKGQ